MELPLLRVLHQCLCLTQISAECRHSRRCCRSAYCPWRPFGQPLQIRYFQFLFRSARADFSLDLVYRRRASSKDAHPCLNQLLLFDCRVVSTVVNQLGGAGRGLRWRRRSGIVSLPSVRHSKYRLPLRRQDVEKNNYSET